MRGWEVWMWGGGWDSVIASALSVLRRISPALIKMLLAFIEILLAPIQISPTLKKFYRS